MTSPISATREGVIRLRGLDLVGGAKQHLGAGHLLLHLDDVIFILVFDCYRSSEL